MRPFVQTAVIAVAALAAPITASGQGVPKKPATDIDPEAMNALTEMGATMRTKSAFGVRAEITREEVLANGQKLQSAATVDMTVRRPDGFKVAIRDGRQDRDLYYDGKTVTVFAPRLGYYASFDAPPTIAETLDRARDSYGIEVPLADLFMWGSDNGSLDRVQSAIQAGNDLINGRECAHFAFRQEAIDWQVWISNAGSPLPCRLVITARGDAAMPQFTATYSWRETPAESPAFSFTPPQGASRINFKTSTATASKEDK